MPILYMMVTTRQVTLKSGKNKQKKSPAINEVNWQQVSNKHTHTKSTQETQERLSPSEVKMGRSSPLCERLCWQIVQRFNNIHQCKIENNLGISLFTVHTIIKRTR